MSAEKGRYLRDGIDGWLVRMLTEETERDSAFGRIRESQMKPPTDSFVSCKSKTGNQEQ